MVVEVVVVVLVVVLSNVVNGVMVLRILVSSFLMRSLIIMLAVRRRVGISFTHILMIRMYYFSY